MLDYLPVGSHGDPVLDFSRLTRDQTAALVEVTGEDFVDGRGENARELRRIRIKLATGSTRWSCSENTISHVDPHEQDFGGAGLAARFE